MSSPRSTTSGRRRPFHPRAADTEARLLSIAHSDAVIERPLAAADGAMAAVAAAR